MTNENDPDEMLKPAAAAAIIGVDTKTVGRWAQGGLISHVKTPGGHRRYRRSDVEALKHDVEAGGKYPTEEGTDGVA